MDEFQEIDRFKDDMKMPLDMAVAKAVARRDKPGNVVRPYEYFSVAHLEKRLFDEIQEYRDSKSAHELIDIINSAAFLWLAKLRAKAETFPDMSDPASQR